RFQIIPEERVMRAKFGQVYDDYRAQVRRWLGCCPALDAARLPPFASDYGANDAGPNSRLRSGSGLDRSRLCERIVFPERSGTMLNDKAVRGSNFTCFHAGPMEGWAQFRLEPPDVPIPVRGKVFLRNLLGSAGLEMSLNVVPPGK